MGGVAIFVNGALGDVSTRFTRQAQTYAEVERFGRVVAGAVLVALGQEVSVHDVVLESRVDRIELKPRDPRRFEDPATRADELRTELSKLQAQGETSHGKIRQVITALQGAESAIKLAEALATVKTIPIALQRFQVWPGMDFFAVPAELFADSASRLRDRLPGRTVRLIGPANGYIGYVPSAEAYDDGGYEVDCALVDRGSAEEVVDRTVAMLNDA